MKLLTRRPAHVLIRITFELEHGGWVGVCRCRARSLPHWTKRSAALDIYDHIREVAQ